MPTNCSQAESYLSPIWPKATLEFLWVLSIGPGPQQLATTPATPYLLKLFNIKTEAIQGSGFSPGKGGGRHFLTHDQITPLSPLPPFTPCSPVLACFFLPMLGPSASPPRQLSFVGATPGFHHTREPHPVQVCVSGFTRKVKDLKCI